MQLYNLTGYIRVVDNKGNEQRIPKSLARLATDKKRARVYLYTPTGLSDKHVNEWIEIIPENVIVPSSVNTVDLLLATLFGWISEDNPDAVLESILTEIVSLGDNVEYLKNFSTIGDTSNLPLHYNSTALENACAIDGDVVVYSVYAINTGGDKYIQVYELPTFGDITAIANNGSGGVTIYTTATVTDYVYIKEATGTPAINGFHPIINVVPGVSFDIAGITFVATGTGKVVDFSNGISATKTYPITPGDDRFVSWLNGYRFQNGLIVCNSTDPNPILLTKGAADCVFEIIYK